MTAYRFLNDDSELVGQRFSRSRVDQDWRRDLG
jgi:hypothetical protein